ncbi:DUF1493 family protein [Serratia ficaria]|uniref:DUF1493 family protein n=1 Tax=Serratia ficaria TaxID=61651 RepID=UPI00217892E8|nr:DUF1493 family protein [Serratia ficaria]MEE4483626.1 DUF1493 family protein [Serratia ficaria]CAI1882301.1 Protein of uncharacterised function (DUF1493) [Serratia ficaria]
MVTDEDVLRFFRSEISALATLSFKTIPLELDTALQEYAEDDELAWAIEKYGEVFGVDVSGFNWDTFYPWRIEWFFRKWFTRTPLRQSKIPLTVRMFAESAKAGRWLY